MYNQNQYYLKKIPKYETKIDNRYNNSTQYPKNSKHIKYTISSEDEKTNSKSNYYLPKKNQTTINKYKPEIKFNDRSYPITNFLKLSNDNTYTKIEKNTNKNNIADNYVNLSNYTSATFNPIINGANKFSYGNGNPIMNEPIYNNNRKHQPFMKTNNHISLKYYDSYYPEKKADNKNNNLYINNRYISNKNSINSYERLNENNSILNKSFKESQLSTINNESKVYSKANLGRLKNFESITEINNNNKLNIFYNKNLYNKNKNNNKKEQKENNIHSFISKTNIINKIANNKINANNQIHSTNNSHTNINKNKKIELSKIKK